MDKLLRRFIRGLDEHLSDDRLASLFCDELPLAERWIARRHLAACWQCRLRQEDLEGIRSARIFDRYKNRRRERLSDEPDREFSRKLRAQIQSPIPRPARPLRFPKVTLPELSPMNPALVVCMVFGFATVLSFYFWWQQRMPRISSNTILVRAERWDTSNFSLSPGVVYQAVRVTMTKESKTESISRAIYRDPQGRRKPKRIKLSESQEQVKNTLTAAGLDWDEPLSASGYQNWHDHQHVREDHIVRAGRHLLRLTTMVPDGLVAQQSLTVRDTDFHPVQRTVELRDRGTVEIAELDFKILTWSAVDADAFEPLERPTTSIASSPARAVTLPHLPEPPSEGQLDEAELAARLILNQLHADTGEGLEIHRGSQAVTVAGVVETVDRKRQLQAELGTVPHVTAAIQSLQDLTANPSSTDAVQTVATGSMPEQLSPLQAYLKAQGRSVGDINTLAGSLFRNALAISQESRDIADLQSRFGTDVQRTAIASATLSELIYSHHERLKSALRRERELLAEARNAASSGQDSGAPHAVSLTDAATRNLELTQELTQSQRPAERTADRILAEMSLAIDDLTAGAHDAYAKSRVNTALSGKK